MAAHSAPAAAVGLTHGISFWFLTLFVLLPPPPGALAARAVGQDWDRHAEGRVAHRADGVLVELAAEASGWPYGPVFPPCPAPRTEGDETEEEPTPSEEGEEVAQVTHMDTSAQCLAFKIVEPTVDVCWDVTPWKNILKKHGTRTKQQVINELQDRLMNPVIIDQAKQSMCGTAAHIFMLALAMPQEYALMVLGLLCQGSFGPVNPQRLLRKATELETPQHVLDQSLSATVWAMVKRFTNSLLPDSVATTDLNDNAISVVDWLAMASLRESAPDYDYLFWKSAVNTEDQGTGTLHIEDYQEKLFGAPKGTGLLFDHVGKPNDQFPLAKWREGLELTRNSSTLLSIHMFVSSNKTLLEEFRNRPTRGSSNHVIVGVVATGRLDECIVWTWAELFNTACDVLKDFVVRMYKVNFDQLVADGHLPARLVDRKRIRYFKDQAFLKKSTMQQLIGVQGREFA